MPRRRSELLTTANALLVLVAFLVGMVFKTFTFAGGQLTGGGDRLTLLEQRVSRVEATQRSMVDVFAVFAFSACAEARKAQTAIPRIPCERILAGEPVNLFPTEP